MNNQLIPTASIIIIGNEILSGRTQDTNISYLARQLKELGIDLIEVCIIKDNEIQIIETVNNFREKYTYVFTTGGIGDTHDDITFQSIAKAFNQSLLPNVEVIKILKSRYGEHFNKSRKQMAMMPENITLIDNPVSKIPSFQIENVFVLAGMPSVMKGMFESLKPKLQKGYPRIFANSVKSYLTEGTIACDLETIQQNYPSIDIGSYPFFNSPSDIGTTIVIQGRNTKSIINATEEVISMIKRHGGSPTIEKEIE